MTEEEFVEIMDDGCIEVTIGKTRNACQGLDIIRKYCPNKGIEGAGPGVIYSVSVSEIVAAGITNEDAAKLRGLNWVRSLGECLAYFV